MIETTASLTTWEGIDRIVVTGTHAFFYLNWIAALILPRRAFADDREFEEFAQPVSTRLCRVGKSPPSEWEGLHRAEN
jgi:hypothetical protein